MIYYPNLILKSYVKFVSNLSLNSQKRFLRNVRGRNIVKPTIINKSIEEVEENFDLKNFQKIASPAIISTLKQNPSNTFDKDGILNEIGQIKVKNFKFKYDAKKKLEEVLNIQNDEKIKAKSVIKQSTSGQNNPYEMTNFNIDNLEDYEDPSVPKSKIKCGGCGAFLHCQSQNEEGFIPAEKFKSCAKKDLMYELCLRCNFLKFKKRMLPIKTSEFDYDKLVLEKIISEKKVHVVLLIDLLDIPNSIYKGWSKLISTQDDPMKSKLDIIIVGNKFDLLPNTGPDFFKSIIECLALNCASKGIKGDQIVHVELISAKTGFNIEKLISSFFKIWNDEGDVYLLGMSNAGKSLLYNRLLSSDYCRPLASNALEKATTSFWPGTTLNSIRFPITFLNESKAKLRTLRLINDHGIYERVDTELNELYKKDLNLKHAEPIGMVGSSFNTAIGSNNEMEANVDSTYNLNPDTGLIEEGENFQKKSDISMKITNEARKIYNEKYFVNKSTFFYDTPGVQEHHEILK